MAYYLSLDGGGTKCACVCYDDDFNVIGSSIGGGTNTTQNPVEVVRANMSQSIKEALNGVTELEGFYYSLVGPTDVLMEEIGKLADVKHVYPMSEPLAGLYAGALSDSGILALSGTGSDIFWIRNGRAADVGGLRSVVGGWGPILGDQGSGTWMGKLAVEAYAKDCDGWGEKTLLTQMFKEKYDLKHDFDMVHVIHGNPSPFRVVGSLTPLIGQAARKGDAVAIGIVEAAGRILAEQTTCLITRCRIPENEHSITCCGGAWKTDSRMFDTFKACLEEKFPGIEVHKPVFEHLMAGPVRILLERGLSRDQVKEKLSKRFPQYCIRW